MIGLKVGDIITFDALDIPVMVASDDKIECEDRQWSLSAFTAEFLPEETQKLLLLIKGLGTLVTRVRS